MDCTRAWVYFWKRDRTKFLCWSFNKTQEICLSKGFLTALWSYTDPYRKMSMRVHCCLEYLLPWCRKWALSRQIPKMTPVSLLLVYKNLGIFLLNHLTELSSISHSFVVSFSEIEICDVYLWGLWFRGIEIKFSEYLPPVWYIYHIICTIVYIKSLNWFYIYMHLSLGLRAWLP